MQLKEFLQVHKDVSSYQSDVLNKRTKSLDQAIRHMTRSDLSELHNIARPNEPEQFTKWRKDNKRNVTNDFIQQFIRMLQRICSQSIQMEYEQYEGLDIYANNIVIPTSALDVNAILVEWPVMPERPEDPPALADFAPNMAIDTVPIIVYSPSIIEDNDDFVIWEKDFVEIDKVKYKRFIAADKRAFQILTPKRDGNGILYYEAADWYVHGLNRVPVAHLPGIVTTEITKPASGLGKNTVTKVSTYLESICFPAFEWFDEGLIQMSSHQVASVNYANPKLVINADIDCPDCSGAGYTGYTDKNEPIACGTCKGTRKISNIGDFSHINIATGNAVDKGASTNNPIYYLEPPGGIKELYDAYMACFDQGRKSLCNDPLEGTGNEAGVAKEMRLEPKQDLMKAYGIQLCKTLEDMVNNRGQLRGTIKIDKPIRITPPLYYETKSPEVLKEQITNSLQGDRFINYMKWVEAVFRKDAQAIKLHKFAVLYAPLCLYSPNEFDSAFNSGVYDERDAIRRDYAFYAVEFVLSREPGIESLKEIKEKCDAFLIEQGVLPEVMDRSTVPMDVTDPAASPTPPDPSQGAV